MNEQKPDIGTRLIGGLVIFIIIVLGFAIGGIKYAAYLKYLLSE